MSNLVAGVGRGQLLVLDDHMASRRKNFERYKEYFASLTSKGYNIHFQGDSPTPNPEPRTPNYFSNRWLTTILINPSENKGLTRDDLRLAFEAENIETRPLWKPMHLQPVFEKYPFYSNQQSAFSTQQSAVSSQSEQLFNDELCLPSGSNLTDVEWERIMSVLEKVFV